MYCVYCKKAASRSTFTTSTILSKALENMTPKSWADLLAGILGAFQKDGRAKWYR